MAYHPVIELPADYDIFDFTNGYDPARLRGLYGIGKYDEDRVGMYNSDLFSAGASDDARTIHVGIDIGAPVGTSVFAFDAGSIFMTGINAAPGDYGGTIITEHLFEGRRLWALHGHLSHASVGLRAAGARIERGDVIGFLGDEKENGGWNPHLHFQLSWIEPRVCDLPGVVSRKDRAQALRDFPDPRLVLGPLYSASARG